MISCETMINCGYICLNSGDEPFGSPMRFNTWGGRGGLIYPLGRSHRPKKANFKVWNAFFAVELSCAEIENYHKLVKRWLPCRDLPFWWLLYANELFDHFIGKVAFSMGSKINKNAKLKINVVNLNPFLMRKPLVT